MTTMKVSDSCSQPILLCSPDNGVGRLVPVSPDITMVPNNETNHVVGEKFTKEIWVSNVTRMKSLHFQLNWNKFQIGWGPDAYRYNDALKLEYVDFDLNNLKGLQSATWNDVDACDPCDHHELTVDIQIKCTASSLNGTFRVATLTFLKLDPWYCGSQPQYTFRQPHEWTAANATVKFQFWKGWFDGPCTTIYFGAAFNPPLGTTFTRGYGIADWVNCNCADTGGGAVNLIISVSTDVAGVKFTIGKVGNPYDTMTKYLTIGDIASVGERVKGSGGVGIGVITLNMDNGLARVWISSTVSVASPDYYWFMPASWDLYYWDGGNWSTLTPTAYTGYAWADIPTLATYRVLGFVSFIGWPKGACNDCVDGFRIIVKDPRGCYELDFDLEPCQTSKWYDTGLYEMCYGKISDLFTFMPIPGDLNRDGVVDITDLIIVSQYYGNAKAGWQYYDFNGDGYVDVFDVVVVSKNFGRTTP
jgi:hypothetical protein